MSTRHLLPAALLTLLFIVPAQAQQEPRDDVALAVEYRANTPIAVSEVLQVWARTFDALVVIGPELKGIKVTFLTHTTRDLTWGTIKKILAFHEVVVTEERPDGSGPWLIRATHNRNIGPGKKGTNRIENGKNLPKRAEIVTAVFQIEHGAGNMIFTTLRGILAQTGERDVLPYFVPGPELMIVMGPASRVEYAGRVIEMLDVAGPRKLLKVFQLTHASATELATTLTGILSGLERRGRPGGPVVRSPRGQSGAAQVFPDGRTNRLAVVALPVDMPLVERVINEFDVRVGPPPRRFHVYKCRNLDSTSLAERLRELFSAGGTPQRPNTPTTPGRQVRPNAAGPVEAPDGTRIVADLQTNTLLIQAEEQTYHTILEVLGELDRKARRVMIEVMVFEVTTPTDQLTIGFELAGLTNAHEGSTRPAGISSFGLSDITPKTDADGNVTGLSRTPSLGGGLTAAITRDSFDRLPILLKALHTQEDVTVITRPFAMTDDNKTAEFKLTDTIPFPKQVQGPVALTQEIDQVTAESSLKIKPRINSEDNLTLEITLSLSTFSGSGSANLPPGTNTRTFTGEAITVPNKSYVVFGGMESWTERTVENKVPFLGDIPILGHLFKNWTRTRSKSRVYVFVRPTIFASEDFREEKHLAGSMREQIQVESGRETWIPPVATDRKLKGSTMQDEAFELFGTGSGNPFPSRGS